MTETEYRYPPAQWVRPCPSPEFTGATNLDLLDWAEQLDAELARCNVDKMMLRRWMEEARAE